MRDFKKTGIVLLFLMCSVISNAQIGVQNIEKNQSISLNSDSKSLGNINILFPEDGHELTLSENKVFTWSSPNNLQMGQEYSCHLRIVKINQTDIPEEVINNEAYFEHLTDTLSTTSDWSENLDTVYFATTQFFAWQIKAYSSDTLLAESDIYTFEGPPLFNRFNAGNQTIYTTKFTKVDQDWDSLCGTGYTIIQSNRIDLSFENIQVRRSGAELFLRSGELIGEYIDTLTITPRYNLDDLNLTMYFDSIIITADKYKALCNVEYAQKFRDDTIKVDVNNWIDLSSDSFYPLGDLYFSDTVIKYDNYVINISKSSKMFVRLTQYSPTYVGTIDYLYKDDTLKFDIPDEASILNYFNSQETLSVKTDYNFSLLTTSGILDLSDKESPGIFQDSLEWEGVYFNNLKVYKANTDTIFTFDIASEPINTVIRESSSWMAYLSNDKLVFNLDSTFSEHAYGEYNYFSMQYDNIKINNLNDSLEWSVAGEIYIPYLKEHYYEIDIPCKNDTILLAETDTACLFQIFPLSVLEFYEFGIIIDDSLYLGEIDHENKEVKIAISPFEDRLYFKPFFRIAGNGFNFHFASSVSEVSEYYTYFVDIDRTYVLQVVSYDGTKLRYEFTFEVKETTTRNLLSNTTIQVYPNPANDFIKVSGVEIGNQLSILDINGRSLYMKKAVNETELINVEEIETGVYFLKIENSENTVIKKVIKL